MIFFKKLLYNTIPISTFNYYLHGYKSGNNLVIK